MNLNINNLPVLFSTGTRSTFSMVSGQKSQRACMNKLLTALHLMIWGLAYSLIVMLPSLSRSMYLFYHSFIIIFFLLRFLVASPEWTLWPQSSSLQVHPTQRRPCLAQPWHSSLGAGQCKPSIDIQGPWFYLGMSCWVEGHVSHSREWVWEGACVHVS